jgi:hypothetical protein
MFYGSSSTAQKNFAQNIYFSTLLGCQIVAKTLCCKALQKKYNVFFSSPKKAETDMEGLLLS